MAKRVVPTTKPTSNSVDTTEILGEHIRFARTSAGIGMVDAAALCNISLKTYGDIEKGKSTVSFGNFLKVLFVFGITLEIDSENSIG